MAASRNTGGIEKQSKDFAMSLRDWTLEGKLLDNALKVGTAVMASVFYARGDKRLGIIEVDAVIVDTGLQISPYTVTTLYHKIKFELDGKLEVFNYVDPSELKVISTGDKECTT